MFSNLNNQFWPLALKELREILRDRRTIITLILMPILVYPLLGVAFQKFLLSQAKPKPGQLEYIIGFESKEDMLEFNDFLSKTIGGDNKEKESQPVITGRSPDGNQSAYLEQQLKDHVIDLGIRKIKNNPDNDNNKVQYKLISIDNSLSSRNAYKYIKKQIENFNVNQLKIQLNRFNINPPTEILFSNGKIESDEKNVTGVSLATIIPLILILMTVTGAVYPAIDLTAGERERGTMETLIAAPIPRMRIMLAKYIAVVTVAMLTAIMNLLAMWTTIYSIGFETILLGDTGVGFLLVLQILALLLLFAGFFSAVLLGITSIARSFKEAQAYLIPVMLVSFSPGILSLMPGIEMNWYLSVMPLINIVLLARNIIENNVTAIPALLAVGSTLFYGYLALHWAAKVFGSDAILYGSSGTWTDLLHQKKSTNESYPVNYVWFAIAIITPLFLYADGILGKLKDLPISERLICSAVITVTLFMVIPILANYFLPNSLKKTFCLHKAKWNHYLGAFLLGISVWPFAYELTISLIATEQLEVLKELFEKLDLNLKAVPLATLLFALAVTPAICEEFFFRGFIQNVFAKNGHPIKAIFLSAFIFAAFHMIVRGSLSLERFFPSFLLGIILGIVYQTSKSVIPGMILHAFHNGLLLTISHHEEFLKEQKWGFNIEAQQHLPIMFLVGSAVVITIGFMTLRWSNKTTQGNKDSQLTD